MKVEFPDNFPVIKLMKFAADNGCVVRFKSTGNHVVEQVVRAKVTPIRANTSTGPEAA